MAGRAVDDRTGATRGRVEQAALDLFVSRGFSATSLREIAQAVGISVPAIYYHFASKDDLLRSVVDPLLAAADRLLAGLSGSPGPGLARRALEAYYDLIVAHYEIYLLVSSDPAVRSHAEVGPRVAEQAATLLDIVAGPEADHARRLRAAAATGALRRPLRFAEVDPAGDRSLIVSAALAALGPETVADDGRAHGSGPVAGGTHRGRAPRPDARPRRSARAAEEER
jgi:AcrR family transcriptional regulator